MSDLSFDIQALLNAPTALDAQNAENQATQGNIATQAQQIALANAVRQQKQADFINQFGMGVLDKYLNADINDPNRMKYYNAAIVLNPSLREGIQQGYKDLSDDAQKQHLQDSGTLLGYVQANDWDNAANHLQSIIDADKKAGQDSSDDEAYLGLVNKAKEGDAQAANQALNLAQLHVSSILGPDKFSDIYPDLVKLPTDIAKAQSDIAANNAKTSETPSNITLNQANAAKAQAEADATNRGEIKAIENPNGEGPLVYNTNPNGAIPNVGQGTYGSGNTAFDVYKQALISTESSANPNAFNLASSAAGLVGFTDGTLADTVRKLYPDATKGMSDKQIADQTRGTPLEDQAFQQLTKDNADKLQGAKFPVTSTTLAAAHKLGIGNTLNLLNNIRNGNPNIPMKYILSPKEQKANPQWASMTGAQFMNNLDNTFKSQPINLDNSNAYSTGDDYLNTLDPALAKTIKAIGDGLVELPNGGLTAAGQKTKMLEKVERYNPNYSPIDFTTKEAIRKDFTSGDAATSIRALNTVPQHLAEFSDLSRKLGNVGFVPLNLARGVWDRTTQNQEGTVYRKRMDALKGLIGEELTAIYKGSGGSEAEAKRFQDQLNDTDDMHVQQQVIGQILHATDARAQALADQYQQGFGATANPIKVKFDNSYNALQTVARNMNITLPPRSHIVYLKQHPDYAKQFDEMYGEGAAQAYLGDK